MFNPRVTCLIIYMKKLLDFDWLRAVQFKRNTSAKSVTPVQITNKSKNLKKKKNKPQTTMSKKERKNKRKKRKNILYHTSARKKGAKNLAVCVVVHLGKAE